MGLSPPKEVEVPGHRYPVSLSVPVEPPSTKVPGTLRLESRTTAPLLSHPYRPPLPLSDTGPRTLDDLFVQTLRTTQTTSTSQALQSTGLSPKTHTPVPPHTRGVDPDLLPGRVDRVGAPCGVRSDTDAGTVRTLGLAPRSKHPTPGDWTVPTGAPTRRVGSTRIVFVLVVGMCQVKVLFRPRRLRSSGTCRLEDPCHVSPSQRTSVTGLISESRSLTLHLSSVTPGSTVRDGSRTSDHSFTPGLSRSVQDPVLDHPRVREE